MTHRKGVEKIAEIIREHAKKYGWYPNKKNSFEGVASAIWDKLKVCPECKGGGRWVHVHVGRPNRYSDCVDCLGKGLVVGE